MSVRFKTNMNGFHERKSKNECGEVGLVLMGCGKGVIHNACG
jgi:hypothetical protein